MTPNNTTANRSGPYTEPNTKVTWLLMAAGFVGVIFFALTINNALPEILAATATDQPPPSAIVIFSLILVQYGGLTAFAVWGGMALARQLRIQPAPLLTDGILPDTIRRLLISTSSGLLVGLFTLALYRIVFLPLTGLPMNLTATQPLWLRLGSAFFYGGITEELIMRLGLLTAFMWIAVKLRGRPDTFAFWTVNVMVWVFFGLGHLPSAVVLMNAPLTPALVLMALILNSVSLLFGWLYWRYGIENAIVAHMAFHIGYTLVGTLVFAS